MIVFSSLVFSLITLIGYFSDRLSDNQLFYALISAKAIEQNSNQSEPPVNQDIHNGDVNSQNQSPDRDNQGNSDLPNEEKPETDSKSNPGQLKAILVVDSGKKHDLVLFRYTTSEGSVSPSGANYPKKPRITLHGGDKLSLISGNQYFKVVAYSMSLDLQSGNNNKNSEQPIYIEKKASKFVIPDINSGTYHFYIKTEYTPSDDDTAYFVDTVKIENGADNKKQSESSSKNFGKGANEAAEIKAKKEVVHQHLMQLNISVQTTSFNQTAPSDIVFKVMQNGNQSQMGKNKTKVLSIPAFSESNSQNITLMAASLNQTRPGDKIIKAINNLSQAIPLQDNKTMEAILLNQTKSDDMILQLNASNQNTTQMPVILQFMPVNRSLYRIELLSANQTVTG
ncbi:MAG: hypothetical protein ACM3JQ_04060 [Candidatus Eiseniibacteriota bacterium]